MQQYITLFRRIFYSALLSLAITALLVDSSLFLVLIIVWCEKNLSELSMYYIPPILLWLAFSIGIFVHDD